MTIHPAAHGRKPLYLAFITTLACALVAPASAPAAGQGGPFAAISVAQDAASDPEKAFITGRYELIQAANQGDRTALQEGLTLIANAAEGGYAPAARFAGTLFMDGTVVPRDERQAIDWLQRAANLGDPEAQALLGDMYADGRLGTPDLRYAMAWYETLLDNPAADNFPKIKWDAARRLAEIYADEEGPAYQPDRSLELWQQAASEGAYPPALEALARATALGIGGPAAPKDALRLYYEAAMAYHGGGVRYGIAPNAYREAESNILAAMESIDPRHKLTHRLRRHIDAER